MIRRAGDAVHATATGVTLSVVRGLLGSESVPVRRFAVAWAGIGGFVLGSTALLLFARGSALSLLFGVVPGIASAIAIHRATRRRSQQTPASIVGASVLAAMVCPFAIMAIGLAVAIAADDPHAKDVLGALLCVGAGIGAVFAAPVGLAFGAIYACVWKQLEQSRPYGRSATEQLWMRFGGSSVALGVAVILLAALAPRPASPPGIDLLVPLAVGTVVFGLLTMARGVLLAVGRRDLVDRVRRGELAGWAVLSSAEVSGADDLPDLFGAGGDEVLVRFTASHEGPFRSTDARVPVARL